MPGSQVSAFEKVGFGYLLYLYITFTFDIFFKRSDLIDFFSCCFFQPCTCVGLKICHRATKFIVILAIAAHLFTCVDFPVSLHTNTWMHTVIVGARVCMAKKYHFFMNRIYEEGIVSNVFFSFIKIVLFDTEYKDNHKTALLLLTCK